MSQPDPDSQHRVEWAPAIPVAFATFLIGVFVWPVGALIALAALATLVVRARRGQWTALTFACVGTLVGAVLFSVFVLLASL